MCSTEYFPGNSVLQPAKTEKKFQHNSGEKQNHRYFKDNILQGIMKRKLFFCLFVYATFPLFESFKFFSRLDDSDNDKF